MAASSARIQEPVSKRECQLPAFTREQIRAIPRDYTCHAAFRSVRCEECYCLAD